LEEREFKIARRLGSNLGVVATLAGENQNKDEMLAQAASHNYLVQLRFTN
jgi:hypothetical protein